MTDMVHSVLTVSIPGGNEAGGAHTRGPWEARRYPEGDCWHIHFGDKGGWLGEVYIDGDDARAASDARLIAAAPELLAALREAQDALHQHYVDWDGEPEDAVPLQLARSKCDAAIAKATAGETRNAEPIHRRDGDAESGGVDQS